MRKLDFGNEREHYGFMPDGDGEYESVLGLGGQAKKRKEYIAELMKGGATKEFAEKKALEKFPKSDILGKIGSYWQKNKGKIISQLPTGEKGNTTTTATGGDGGSSPERSSFWGKYKLPIIIGSSAVVLGTILYFVKRK